MVDTFIGPPDSGVYANLSSLSLGKTANGEEIVVPGVSQTPVVSVVDPSDPFTKASNHANSSSYRAKGFIDPNDPFASARQESSNFRTGYNQSNPASAHAYNNAQITPQGYIGATQAATSVAVSNNFTQQNASNTNNVQRSFAAPNPFLYALAREYWAAAVYLTGEYQDINDRALFEEKAEHAAAGFAVLPESPKNWNLNIIHRDQLLIARTYLLNVLEQGGRFATPQLGARAQARYDCWVAEQEKNHNPTSIALACKTEFEKALINIQAVIGSIRNYVPDAPRTSAVKNAEQQITRSSPPSIHEQYVPPSFETVNVPPPSSMGFARESNIKGQQFTTNTSSNKQTNTLAYNNRATQNSNGEQQKGEFIVYFGFNAATMNENAISQVNKAVGFALQIGARRFDLVASSDTAGDAQYNLKLARKRADVVERYIKERSNVRSINVITLGEVGTPVPTSDNVSEPRNRSVKILVY